MALDISNNSQNAKVSQTSSQNAGAKAVASQASSGPAQPTPAQMGMRPPRFWMVLALVVILIVAAIGAFYLTRGSRNGGVANQAENSQTKANASPVDNGPSPIPGASPISLPKVEDQSEIAILEAYFKKISTNFKQGFMAMVPKTAAAEYKNYLNSTGDAKVSAAQSFYIYLANPANLANSEFKTFLADVKTDLEKTLGKPLFE